VSFSGEEFAELKRRLNGGAAAETALSGKALERFEEKLRSGKQA
jgi:thymidylate synthase (FAD)